MSPDALLSPADLRRLAAQHGIRPDKSLGQHFLVDPNTVRRIVATAALGRDEVVLEVGPGLGSLTRGLLPAVRRVVAVEVDRALAAALPQTVASSGVDGELEVVAADMLAVTDLPGPPPTALVANLPYNVAVPVLLTVLERFGSLRHGLVMVQQEVVDRLVAPPGSRTYGAPSVKLAWYAAARAAGTIPRTVFWPTPNVDSALVAFQRREPPVGAGRVETFVVVDAAFAQRRKTLRAALARWAGSAAAAEEILRRAGVDPGLRGRRCPSRTSPGSPRRRSSGGALEDVLTSPPHRGAPLVDRRALSGVPDPVTARVPAKVNLHLSVGPRLPDGYHDVTTVLHAVSLYDEVAALPADPDITAEVVGEGAELVPAGPGNLAVAAAMRLAARAGVRSGVRLRIRKAIPVAAGLAGGSADAAGALVACDALWRTGLDRGALSELAATLGSDVPFALLGGTALGTGRGEQVTSALGRGTFHWVLAFAERGLPTAQVYAEYDRGRPVPESPPDGVLAALRVGDAVALGRALHNDLQPAALRLRPALRQLLDAGMERGALGAVVCGSGPTCAFLARSAGEAVGLAAAIAGSGVCRGVRTATGPVPGARVVTE